MQERIQPQLPTFDILQARASAVLQALCGYLVPSDQPEIGGIFDELMVLRNQPRGHLCS